MGAAAPERRHRLKVAVLLVIALITGVSCIAALSWAVVLHQRLGNISLNMLGDQEKTFIDECMRDFEILDPSDSKYQEQRRNCVREFQETERFHWLPLVRSTVDERICGQDNLCEDSDPGQCKDSYGTHYRAGEVTTCYSLLDEAKQVWKTAEEKAALESRFANECRRSGRWEDYSHQVKLEYCMWKHESSGVCMNSMRTQCLQDDSCCPQPQKYMDSDGVEKSTNSVQYTCQQSPVLGIYCQHVDYTAPSNSSVACNRLTCPNFDWCQDLVDVPGQCLGEGCQDYERSCGFAIALIVLAVIAFAVDATDVCVFMRWPRSGGARLTKGFLNAAALVLKGGSFFLLLSSGVSEFVDTTIANQCFNEAGNRMLDDEVKEAIWHLLISISLTALGSLALSPLLAIWSGTLTELPYAKVTR